jgi:hypothetical protein
LAKSEKLSDIGARMAKTKGVRRSRVTSEVAALIHEATKGARGYLIADRQLELLEEKRLKEIEKINRKYESRTRDLANERQRLGNRLHLLTAILIRELNPGARFVQLRSVRLSFKSSPGSLEIVDEAAARRRIASLGWTKECVKVEYKILKGPLKKKLNAEGAPNRMKGVRVIPGEDYLYVNNVKVDHKAQSGPETADSELTEAA